MQRPHQDEERGDGNRNGVADRDRHGWALVELIEAGVRAGRSAEVAAALDRLSARTRATP